MKHTAPIIPGPLEFDGLENELIFIEVDEDAEVSLLGSALWGKVMLIFSPAIDIELGINNNDFEYSVVVQVDSTYKIYNYLKNMRCKLDFIVVDRIDMLDNELNPKERGAQQAAFINMLAAPNNLRGANLIVTSSFQEQNIKKKSSRYLNLKSK